MLSFLVIEDNEDDICLFQAAAKREQLDAAFRYVRSGQEGIEYLLGEGIYADRARFPAPHVVLTDLNMPQMNGFQVLEWVRNHATFALLPILVMSASNREDDIHASYARGTNAYLVKPGTLDGLQKMIRATYDFWAFCARP